MRKSFIIHIDSLSILDKLTVEQAGLFINAIRNYRLTGEIPSEFWLQIALEPFINQFNRDDIEYAERIERNRINGSKGGRPQNPKEPTVTQKTQSVISQPKKADNDNDSDNDSVSDSVNVFTDINNKPPKKTKPKNTFIPPTIDDVIAYVGEKGYNKELAKKIFEYYNTAQWKDSSGKQILNWKQKIIGVWLTGKNDQYKSDQTPERRIRLFQ